ncbi:restriction endonuclease subunit S [Microbulbifer sp. SSSA008]|uniref:restriction endonuclease subunit S n=1 Tax=Microbulbifer sp. SSSA008 TaxID=3243380 RepID=UPI00403916DF
MSAEQLITENLELWTSAVKAKKTQGRGSNSKRELYGIKKLRELILELAVRGKLVLQDPNDEPASVLLERIATEKSKLIKSKTIKKQNPLPEMNKEEEPFFLPQGWQWVKLGELVEMYNGRAFKSSEWDSSGLPIVRIQNLNNKQAEFNYFNGELAPQHRIKNGSFLISWSGTPGTSFGAFIWEGDEAALNQHINNCIFHSNETNLQYMKLAVNGCMNHFIDMAQGAVGLKHVTKGTLNNAILGFPPLSEQNRIVVKVDELMALCDQLEQQTEASLDAHQQLVDTLLATLTSAQDAEELKQNWARLSEHFDSLITTDYAVEQLKQTILQLAVMGKLVPQDPNDEPASALLERIAAEKEQLVKEKKIKKQKPLPGISDKDQQFELPTGWSLCRLGNLGYDLGGGTPSKSNKEYWNGSIPWVSPKDMKLDYIYKAQDSVSELALKETTAKEIPIGSLLMVVRGMILSHSFPVAITKTPLVINQDIKALVFTHIDENFLLLTMKALKPYILSQVDHSSHGTCKLASDKIWETIVCIPPLEEQRRIISQVNDLIKLCHKLKIYLDNAQSSKLQLSDSVIERAL